MEFEIINLNELETGRRSNQGQAVEELQLV